MYLTMRCMVVPGVNKPRNVLAIAIVPDTPQWEERSIREVYQQHWSGDDLIPLDAEQWFKLRDFVASLIRSTGEQTTTPIQEKPTQLPAG